MLTEKFTLSLVGIVVKATWKCSTRAKGFGVPSAMTFGTLLMAKWYAGSLGLQAYKKLVRLKSLLMMIIFKLNYLLPLIILKHAHT